MRYASAACQGCRNQVAIPLLQNPSPKTFALRDPSRAIGVYE